MTRDYIRYRSEYKHQLASAYQVVIPIEVDIDTEYIQLDEAGELTVKNGYAWDGPSGPVVDTPENMRASLVHDALYQLMRVGKLSSRSHRKTADELFRDMCKEDGVSSFTANIYYKALRKFGKPSASHEKKRKIHRAPEDKDKKKKKKRKRIRAGLKATQRNR